MKLTFDSMVKQIEAQAHANDPDALAQSSKLVEQYPTEARAWALRAYVLAGEKNWTKAIDNLTQALNVCLIDEPCFLFNRGRYYIKLGNYQCAIDDFTCGITACDLYSSDYYREMLHFFRAYAFLKLSNKVAALEDLNNVREGFVVWTDRLCSKQELLVQCSDGIPLPRPNAK